MTSRGIEVGQVFFFGDKYSKPMGAKVTWGTKAMTTGITFDIGVPPILQDSSLRMNTTFAPVFSKIGFDMNNKVVYRRDGNQVGNTGIRGSRINDRDPRFKITVEHELQAVFDFYALYEANTVFPVKFQIGTVVGKRFFGFFPEAQFAGAPTLSDLEGIRGLECELLCTSSAQLQGSDGDFEFLWL